MSALGTPSKHETYSEDAKLYPRRATVVVVVFVSMPIIDRRGPEEEAAARVRTDGLEGEEEAKTTGRRDEARRRARLVAAEEATSREMEGTLLIV